MNKDQKNKILADALSEIRDNAAGSKFVRVFLNDDGSVESNIFSNDQWNNQNESRKQLYSFQQDDMNWVEGGGSWDDTERGREWLAKAEKEIWTKLNNL